VILITVMVITSMTFTNQGRVRISKEQRRKILAQFERSGLSGARFAKMAGIRYSTFAGSAAAVSLAASPPIGGTATAINASVLLQKLN
jgi:hypothetical protein